MSPNEAAETALRRLLVGESDVLDDDVPTVAFSGSDDIVVPPAHGGWYARQVAGARHIVEPGWDHLVIAGVWRTIVDGDRLGGQAPVAARSP